MAEVYDVVILGSGPAGLTAALYSARYVRKCCIISESFGGMTSKAGAIENWPGEKNISGMDLIKKFKDHVDSYDVKYIEKAANGIVKEGDTFLVDLGDEKIVGKTVILTLGTKPRELEIKGEKELVGRGVSHCATCDGMFFKGKDVVVIGGADSAAKAALYLADIANSVKIVYRKELLRCEGIYCNRIEEKENIEIVYNTVPLEIVGEEKVEGIKVKSAEDEKELKCDGVFIEIGADPSSGIAKSLGLDLDDRGHIKTGKDTNTSVAGIYAAGDMTNTPLRQIVTAAAEGAIAANQAHEFLQKK
jgi:thioredoxin reductase (NADPH)